MSEALVLESEVKTPLRDKVMELLPEGGNLSMCMTCGLCSSGCPATGLENMDPRKFLRMIAMGLEEEAIASPWVWMCTMCQRCIYACPMAVNIPQLVYYARQSWPRDTRPKGILGSCDAALMFPTNSAMGFPEEDFIEAIEEQLEIVQESDERFKNLKAPMNKQGAHFFLNQNSREPGTEPDELAPLWKILDVVGADWTYGSTGWAAENYCMFAADDESWEKIVRNKMDSVKKLGCKVWLNTE